MEEKNRFATVGIHQETQGLVGDQQNGMTIIAEFDLSDLHGWTIQEECIKWALGTDTEDQLHEKDARSAGRTKERDHHHLVQVLGVK